MNITELLFGLLVIVTQFIEAVTGFGSTVMALPFAIALTSVSVAVPVLSLHTWLFSAWVVAIDRKKIIWRQYLTVMAFVLMGLPLGMLAFSILPEDALKRILAVFMIAVSINGIIRNLRNQKCETGMLSIPMSPRKRAVLYGLLFLGGIIHGAFATGGPLLIIYVTLVIKEKGAFRATMCSVWLSLNTILLTRFILTSEFTPEVTRLSLITLVFLVIGAAFGTWAHKRIPDRYFTRVVYVVLFLSGCFLIYSTF